MCDVCVIQNAGLADNIRSRMNGHKLDNRRFLNVDFCESDTSVLYSHIMSHDVNMCKLQILEILENVRSKYTNGIHQLEISLDAKVRHWILELESLIPQGLNVADSYHSSRKTRSYFFTFV